MLNDLIMSRCNLFERRDKMFLKMNLSLIWCESWFFAVIEKNLMMNSNILILSVWLFSQIFSPENFTITYFKSHSIQSFPNMHWIANNGLFKWYILIALFMSKVYIIQFYFIFSWKNGLLVRPNVFK